MSGNGRSRCKSKRNFGVKPLADYVEKLRLQHLSDSFIYVPGQRRIFKPFLPRAATFDGRLIIMLYFEKIKLVNQ